MRSAGTLVTMNEIIIPILRMYFFPEPGSIALRSHITRSQCSFFLPNALKYMKHILNFTVRLANCVVSVMQNKEKVKRWNHLYL